MGCRVSSEQVSDLNCRKYDSKGTAMNGPVNAECDYIQTINERSPRVRLEHSGKMKELKITGEMYTYKVRYCHISQRGYYPNAMGKANQDSYIICESLMGDPNSHLFGIFDGHGEYGDSCSHFAANNVPSQLVKELRANGGMKALDGPKMESIYCDTLLNSNLAMHQGPIDDTLSGTTSITVIFRGDTLLVANVGDSRAIIASEMEEGLVYSPLSNDQTPFRKDERDRVKLKGARVLTLEQIEGNEPMHENWGAEGGDIIDEIGDPPRVWDESLERPGCAFTRSLGDSIAESCGVCAEPEVLAWKLSPFDKYVIIASDGLFEFLTSQAVIDIISKFENVIDGAKYVVAEAYRLWLTYDERTDDITMIVIKIEDMQEVSATQHPITIRRQLSSIKMSSRHLQVRESKPVRRAMTKAKRKLISETWDREESQNFDINALMTQKSPEDLARISTMVQANYMFQHLTPQQTDQIFQIMALRHVKSGETIIKEGDHGDMMYIVDHGQFHVSKKDENGVNQAVITYTTSGVAFGELALMYRQKRAATVRAATDGALWTLGRLAFRAVLMKRRNIKQGLLKLLKSVPVLSALSFVQLERLCNTTIEQTFEPKAVVAEAGCKVDWVLCVVRSGMLKVIEREPTQTVFEYRGEGKFFSRCELAPEGVIAGSPLSMPPDPVSSYNSGLALVGSRRFISSSPLRQYSTVLSQGISTVVFVPLAAFLDFVGSKGEKDFVTAVIIRQQQAVSGTGTAVHPRIRRSIFSMPERQELSRVMNVRSELTLLTAVLPIGDFAYLGTFRHESGKIYSVKVIAKVKAAHRKVDMRLLDERIFLSALQGFGNCVPKIVSTFQDSRVAMLLYEDVFCCDLAAAMTAGVITETQKSYYAACVFAAVTALHNNGLMHRFVTPEAVYITTKGVPMLSDMRYSKRMDGSKSFTICGDTLFFAPEIIRQEGYDYSVDLWAFGILMYEMYEDVGPFGPPDVEDTVIFTACTAHKEGCVPYTDKTPPLARSVIGAMLRPDPHTRGGYLDSKVVTSMPYFADIKWDYVGYNDGLSVPVGLKCSMGEGALFEESSLEPHSSLLFQQF